MNYESKKNEFRKNNDKKEINYLTISKESEEFKSVLTSKSLAIQDYKVAIAHRTDLAEDEILKLIEYGSKEVIITLARCQSLSSEVITKMLPNSVYLVKKNLIEKQTLSEDQKTNIFNQMSKYPTTYVNLFEQLKEL